VSNARSGCGSRAHRNAIADVSTGSFMLPSFSGRSGLLILLARCTGLSQHWLKPVDCPEKEEEA
jgi:hypothetical protein